MVRLSIVDTYPMNLSSQSLHASIIGYSERLPSVRGMTNAVCSFLQAHTSASLSS